MPESDMYRKLYVTESRDNHEILVRNLLVLEVGSDNTAIDEIFRAAHTLKGMSASMGFEGMERLCHAMEDVFQLIRNGKLTISQALVDQLLQCTDQIESMLDSIEGGGDGASEKIGELTIGLAAWSGGDASRTQGEATAAPGVHPDGAADDGAEEPRYSLCIRLDAGCSDRNLRAMLVLQNLEDLGRIVTCDPLRQVIEDGEFGGTFSVVVESDAGEDALKTAAAGTEVAEVTIAAAPLVPMNAPGNPPLAAPSGAETAKMVERQEKNREVKNIRVDISRLDTMMNLVEDLVINRGRLKQIATRYEIKELDEALSMMSRSVGDLQNLMMNIRMIPLNHIFNRFPRVVRDVAHHDGKDVEFIMDGGDTELDRSIMDGLSDPLLHLIRNAVNHGIELPEVRERNGKPRKGVLRLSARRERDNVILEIEDDGAGIQTEKVLAKAIEKGLVTAENAPSLSHEEIVRFLFEPGFSTADVVTDISGRGVGLDVVRSTIESLKGTINVETEIGRGTKFQLMLPPTMAIVDVMMVRIGESRCSIPIHNIVEVASLKADLLYHVGGREAIMLRDEVLPLHRLEDMFGKSESRDVLIVLQALNRKYCIPVSAVEGQQEVVVKPLSMMFGTCRGISGVTIPGDGDVVPILDVNALV